MRLGRFIVTGEFYRNAEMMIKMQRGMAVLNVRMVINAADRYEFQAVGEMFDDIPDYSLIPEYKVMFVPADEVTFKFERI